MIGQGGRVLSSRSGRFRLDVKGKFFTERVVECWNRLPRDVVDAAIPGGV